MDPQLPPHSPNSTSSFLQEMVEAHPEFFGHQVNPSNSSLARSSSDGSLASRSKRSSTNSLSSRSTASIGSEDYDSRSKDYDSTLEGESAPSSSTLRLQHRSVKNSISAPSSPRLDFSKAHPVYSIAFWESSCQGIGNSLEIILDRYAKSQQNTKYEGIAQEWATHFGFHSSHRSDGTMLPAEVRCLQQLTTRLEACACSRQLTPIEQDHRNRLFESITWAFYTLNHSQDRQELAHASIVFDAVETYLSKLEEMLATDSKNGAHTISEVDFDNRTIAIKYGAGVFSSLKRDLKVVFENASSYTLPASDYQQAIAQQTVEGYVGSGQETPLANKVCTNLDEWVAGNFYFPSFLNLEVKTRITAQAQHANELLISLVGYDMRSSEFKAVLQEALLIHSAIDDFLETLTPANLVVTYERQGSAFIPEGIQPTLAIALGWTA